MNASAKDQPLIGRKSFLALIRTFIEKSLCEKGSSPTGDFSERNYIRTCRL